MPVRHDFNTDDEFKIALTDWFAGQALAGMLASDENVVDMDCLERSHYAYLQADSMLAQRTKGT